jgi:hypothetical protein
MKQALLALAVMVVATACTVVHVSPLDPRDRPTTSVCIERNAKVRIEDFLSRARA